MPAGVELTDLSDETALLAVQGPKAAEVLNGNVPDEAFGHALQPVRGRPTLRRSAIIARTGYTGEDGFELYLSRAMRHRSGTGSWPRPAGGLEPVGLGARDTLRLEMAYMLYGNDIDGTTSPLERASAGR
jgi:aminomethyltransferase